MLLRTCCLLLAVVSAFGYCDPSVRVLSSIGVPYQECSVGSEDVCEGEECNNRVWCFQGPRRFFDFSRVFHDATLTISFPDGANTCIRAETEDTFLTQSILSSEPVETLLKKKLEKGYSIQRKMFDSTINTFNVFGSCSKGECYKVVSPYRKSCVSLCGQSVTGKVKATLTYSDGFRIKYPMLLMLGVLLFQLAGVLSDQIVLYYLSGMSMGVGLSLVLIIFFVFKRVMPRRSSVMNLMFAAAVQSFFGVISVFSGWWDQLLSEHIELVLLYIVIAASLSLALTHWLLKGPNGVKVGSGLRDIVKAAIHLCGVFCVSMSTRSLFWSVFFALALLGWGLLAGPLMSFRDTISDKLWPESGIAVMEENYLADHRFLSPSQYEVQGKIETERHMKNLLNSPHFQSWAIKNAHRLSVKGRDE